MIALGEGIRGLDRSALRDEHWQLSQYRSATATRASKELFVTGRGALSRWFVGERPAESDPTMFTR